MRILFKKYFGFTLIELLVVVAISLILAVIAGISLNSRLTISRLEQAAQTLVSDLRYARSSAMFKNCPVRVVFCDSRDCGALTATRQSGGYGNFIGTSADAPTSYYAMIRESQKEDSSGSTPCYNSNAVNALSSPSDPWQYWDFDRRPQSLPQGVIFTSIYSTFPAGTYDWSSTSDAQATNSIYFSSSTGQFNVPVSGGTASNGDTIAFQLSLSGCSPASSSDDCLAYLITVGSGGDINMVKCAPGGRADNTDNCFQ